MHASWRQVSPLTAAELLPMPQKRRQAAGNDLKNVIDRIGRRPLRMQRDVTNDDNP